jgi:dTDP-glucose pyrophosphorylase
MRQLTECFIRLDCTIRSAIETIDRSSVRIALVIDENNCLLGTVTDGDIRRALLRGQSLDNAIEGVMNCNYRYLFDDASDREVLALMQRETLYQIPILDRQKRVVRLCLLEDLLTKPALFPNSVILMAGGKGKRLRPLTMTCPKPMLPVAGKPMLEIIVKQCIEAGFKQFFIAVNYLKQYIVDYFGDGHQWGINIRYLEESYPLGTAGALSLLPERPQHPLLVINSDVLTRINFKSLMRFHEEQHAAATVCVREHSLQIPYGVVHIQGSDVTALQEKPILSHLVNAGIYVLHPKVLERLARDAYCDMPQLLESSMRDGDRVSAFPIHEYWLDVGHPETLMQANGEWQ